MKASSPELDRSVWANLNAVKYLIDSSRAPSVQSVGLETLLVVCESKFPDEVLELLIHRPGFCDYIRCVLSSGGPSSRITCLRIIDAALLFLLSQNNKEERVTWQNNLGAAIFEVKEEDSSSPESHFCLMRVKCTLCPDERSGELSNYWQRWRQGKSALEVARVVPVAQWVLTHYWQSGPKAWFAELRTGFKTLLQISRGGDFDSGLLVDLIDRTDKWLRSGDPDYRDTIAVLQTTSDQIMMGW